jgi:hypothetical protein
MNKSYYVTTYNGANEVAAEILTGFAYLLYAPMNRSYSKIYYVIEDNDKNKEWLVFEILKGNINPSMKFEFDLSRFNKGESYNMQERGFFMDFNIKTKYYTNSQP